jgi:hypothetical protein
VAAPCTASTRRISRKDAHHRRLRRNRRALPCVTRWPRSSRPSRSTGSWRPPRPDAFLPDLATSLNNQSRRLSELGRREDALAAIKQALHLVLPVLERAHYFLPDGGLTLGQTYLRRCEEAERDPDPNLIQRVVAVLVSAAMIPDDQ